ncbi:MAG: hypothetical protein ACK4NP_11545 [Parvularculaceae bacterium]
MKPVFALILLAGAGPSAAVSAFIGGAIVGEALGPDEEQAQIAAKWKRGG